MTLNLEADIGEQAKALNEKAWSKTQAGICVRIANAKLDAFIHEAELQAEMIRTGFVTRPDAADYLDTAARYNQLYFEYGADRIQEIMSAAIGLEAAA